MVMVMLLSHEDPNDVVEPMMLTHGDWSSGDDDDCMGHDDEPLWRW